MTSFIDDNGNVLDYSGADLLTTAQVASFYSFNLKGDYTVDFKIPNTAKNRKALGYYGPQQIVSPAFSQLSYSMIRNGTKIRKGYLIIKGSDQNNIDCFFVSGNSNWFDSLQFNVRDIIFPSRFVVSWESMDTQKTATEGIVFPIVDWCYNGYHRASAFNLQNYHTAPGPFDAIQEVFPCLYMSTLIKEMGNHGRINITGDLLSDPVFNRIIITPDGPQMTISDSLIKKTVARTTLSANESISSDHPVFDVLTEKGDLATYSTTTGYYTCPFKGVYKCVVKYNVAVNFVLTTGIEQWRGGSMVGSRGAWSDSNQTSGDYTLDFACEAGDQLRFAKTGGGTISMSSTVAFMLENEIKPYYIYNSGSGTYQLSCVGLVMPNAICPDITGVDLIKSLCVMFGAFCTYDETSKTLSINKTSKIRRENAKDWSRYYVSHYSNYQTGIANNNFIKYQDTPEAGLMQYDQYNVAGFGGYNLQTSFNQLAYKDLYQIPFAGSWDEVCQSMLGWFMPYIKFYDLKDDLTQTWSFTTVTNSGGNANFNAASGNTFSLGDLVKISGSFYSGYGIISSATSTDVQISGLNYINTDAGKLTKVQFSPVQSVNRLLLAYPNSSTSSAGGGTFNFYYGVTLASSVSSTTACLAWFDKPKMGFTIDDLRDSLAMDTVANRSYNNTMGEKYLQHVKNIFNNPTVKAKMLLPANVFQSFDFTNFVYLKTETLEGYFFVQKLEWKDSQTECNVELLYVD